MHGGVYMRRYSDSKANKVFISLVIIVVLLLTIFCIFHKQLSKHMSEICEYKGRETANYIISSVISEELKGSTEQEFIHINRSNDQIVSIETNSRLINQLQVNLKESINNKLSELENEKISIPIGTMSGITVLSGRGPDITLKLHQIGAADSEIISEFTSAGINQTKHRLILKVNVELSAILPTHSTDITVENDFVISETIIVGKVPDGYIGTYKI